MIKRLFFGTAFLCCSFFPALQAQVSKVDKNSDGVTVSISGKESIAQVVKLQVVADNIIHVTSSPAKGVKSRKSLIVADTIRAAHRWELSQTDDKLFISTSLLKAELSLITGEVKFRDNNGKSILEEVKRDCNTFIPGIYSGDTFFKLKQSFVSEASEGYYGLGQHQAGVMNYKGRQVTLSQYNTDVAVPFVVSSRNYGILWDNYSITRAGDVRDLMPLSGLKLYSANGGEGWLTAKYTRKNGEEVISRPESVIDYSFIKDQKNFPDNFKLADGHVRWEGALESPYTGIHTFFLKYAGYVKVWIDGKLQADRWRQAWNPGSVEIPVNFEKGKRYPVVIEWNPDGGESYLGLNWLGPVPAAEKEQFAFLSEAGDNVDYYLVTGKNMDDVIAGYRTLTGRAPIVPKWALGFWQSRERYKTQEEILTTVKTFRDKKIPLDNIVLDWSYWPEEAWGSQDFDTRRFPDASKMLADLHSKYNTHFMISVWPKFYKGIDSYNEFSKNGWLYARNVEDGRKDWIGKGYQSTFYDPFNDNARAGFWNLINKKLYTKGIDAWWMDATEPDLHSNLDVDTRKSIFSPSTGSATRYFNAFPLLNAKAVYEGQRSVNPDDRVFILTRSSFAGQQRFAATTWSGDISSRWHDMKDQIAAGINFSMSGLPYWTMDIGGFSVEKRYEKASGKDLDEWRELNARWFQFGAFTPIFRVHGQFPYREIYNIAPEGHPAYESMLFYNKLRYRLLPYIYSLAGKAYHDNYTIMRGLVMDFEADTAVKSIADQFLFGPSLMINPVTEYKASSRDLYLPAGSGWYDIYTGKYFKGGRHVTASAPYGRMPLMVKAGAIIPIGPEIQYTSEKTADPLTLYVYTGQDASFDLYEDEGINYNYEKGLFSRIPLSYNEKSGTLTIGSRQGDYPGMLQDRTFRIVRIGPGKAGALDFNRKADKTISYSGKQLSIKM